MEALKFLKQSPLNPPPPQVGSLYLFIIDKVNLLYSIIFVIQAMLVGTYCLFFPIIIIQKCIWKQQNSKHFSS